MVRSGHLFIGAKNALLFRLPGASDSLAGRNDGLPSPNNSLPGANDGKASWAHSI